MTEHEIQNEIRLAIGKELPNVRLFRANVGMGWTGRIAGRSERWGRRPSQLVLENYRAFSTGLPNGTPDLIGFKTLPDGVAQFAFIEVKQPGGRVRPEQERMIKFLLDHGAVGGIAHSPEEALELLR